MIRNLDSIDFLMADDDAEDRLLIEKALKKARLVNSLRFVEDGQELLDYLRHEGQYHDPASAPRPGIILLDLNMPRKDGRQALAEIKADPSLRSIPIVILTTSKAGEDIARSYDLGANSYITKPARFGALIEVLHQVSEYWFDIVELPGGNVQSSGPKKLGPER